MTAPRTNTGFFSGLSEADRAKYADVPIEQLPPAVLAMMFRELVAAYSDMATAAGTMRDYIVAACDRLDEKQFEQAAQTIRRAAVLVLDADAPPKKGCA